jgi:hypothetical protein
VRCVWRCFTTTTTNHHSMMRAQPRQWCPERAGHGLFARHRSQDLRPGRKRDLIVKIVYLLCPGANPALRLPPRPDGADGSVCVCVCVCGQRLLEHGAALASLLLQDGSTARASMISWLPWVVQTMQERGSADSSLFLRALAAHRRVHLRRRWRHVQGSQRDTAGNSEVCERMPFGAAAAAAASLRTVTQE